MWQEKWKEKVRERNLKIIFDITGYNSEKESQSRRNGGLHDIKSVLGGETYSRDPSEGLQGSQGESPSHAVF